MQNSLYDLAFCQACQGHRHWAAADSRRPVLQAERARADSAMRDRAEIEASLSELASTLEGRMKGLAAQVQGPMSLHRGCTL